MRGLKNKYNNKHRNIIRIAKNNIKTRRMAT